MKLTGRQITDFLRQPDAKFGAVLVYGPDLGLVKERAARIARTVVDDLGDPFRVAELTGRMVVEDPARLGDELGALALTGGRRVVRVRDAGNAVAKPLAAALAGRPGDTLVVVEAGDLAPRDALRALFEKAPGAAALPCYADSREGLEALIGDVLGGAGLRAEPAALDLLAGRLGADRQLSRRELEKLVLYVGPASTGGGSVTPADVEAVIGDVSALALDQVADAVGDGDIGRLVACLDRAFAAGHSTVAILRQVGGHLRRVHRAAAAVAAGARPRDAIAALRPKVHFSRGDALARHLRLWPVARLTQALAYLTETEITVKQTGAADQTLCRHALLRLANSALRARGERPTLVG